MSVIVFYRSISNLSKTSEILVAAAISFIGLGLVMPNPGVAWIGVVFGVIGVLNVAFGDDK